MREATTNPTTPGEDKGSAAQSEPISELEQGSVRWAESRRATCKLCKRVFPNFCKRHTPYMRVRTEKLYTESEVRQSFQDGVSKALEALPEKYEESEYGLAPHEEPYNKAISQAKENLGRLKG